MNPAADMLETVALLWASGWIWYAIRRLIGGDRSTILIVYLVFYAEYVLPLGLDLVLGIPDYEMYGFAVSSHDLYVRLLYCLFVALAPYLWLCRAPFCPRLPFVAPPRWVRTLLRIASFLPVYLLLLAPEPKVYLTYAGIMDSGQSMDVKVFHIVVSIATMAAVFCAASRCLVERVGPMVIAEIVLAAAVAAWMNGKRYIVAEALFLIMLALWYRGLLAGRRLVRAVVLGAIGMIVFSVAYQSSIRAISFDAGSREDASENMRIDYARDSRVRMALFAEVYPERMRILDHRGENIEYYATCFIPRSLWKDKPYSYATYFTSALLDLYPQNLGWGMTTGIFDETIANFGIAGLLIGPLLVQWLCRIGDRASSWNAHILTCIVICLLMSVQVVAFVPLIALWLMLVGRGRSRRTQPLPLVCTAEAVR